MRTLLWYVGGVLEAGAHDHARNMGRARGYTLEQDYEPVELRVRAEGAPQGASIVLDVHNDGTSIFDWQPSIVPDAKQLITRSFKALGAPTLAANSLITLDIDSVGNKYAGDNLVVELDIEPLA